MGSTQQRTLLSACTTQPPLAATQPDEAAALAPTLGSYAAADGLVPVGATKVRLRGKSYAAGFEQLRIVRRDHTGRAVAAQVRADVHPRNSQAYRPVSQHRKEVPASGRRNAALRQAGELKQARSLCRETRDLARDRGHQIAETAAQSAADPHTPT
jgi:hypothetical protein